ncbi:hypothetical protein L1987_84108 [Smallanthus sonchifolius]|uniref:Uncharacterized protein n=1 Tax=Smallanthus sonchifolius TaxID=185202 RepID=A0ACB8YI06_9ASTR|nr:hypothetical protein L1987_84108 [Smallanthus sonchifolius]
MYLSFHYVLIILLIIVNKGVYLTNKLQGCSCIIINDNIYILAKHGVIILSIACTFHFIRSFTPFRRLT